MQCIVACALLTSIRDVVGHWGEYFEDLLNSTNCLPMRKQSLATWRWALPSLESGGQKVQQGPWGCIGVCPTSLRVLCVLWEGIWLCPSGCPGDFLLRADWSLYNCVRAWSALLAVSQTCFQWELDSTRAGLGSGHCFLQIMLSCCPRPAVTFSSSLKRLG